MLRIRQRGPSLEEPSTLSPIYKSFASSLAICLLFSALVLAAVILRYTLRRHQCSSPLVPAPDYQATEEKLTIQPSSFSHNMPESSDKDSFPHPSSEALPIDPILGDPLAGVYYPITSGQLAALAERKAAESQSGQGSDQNQATSSGVAALTSEESESLEARLEAYIQYFENREEGETWQRRVVHFQPPADNNQSVT